MIETLEEKNLNLEYKENMLPTFQTNHKKKMIVASLTGIFSTCSILIVQAKLSLEKDCKYASAVHYLSFSNITVSVLFCAGSYLMRKLYNFENKKKCIAHEHHFLMIYFTACALTSLVILFFSENNCNVNL